MVLRKGLRPRKQGRQKAALLLGQESIRDVPFASAGPSDFRDVGSSQSLR